MSYILQKIHIKGVDKVMFMLHDLASKQAGRQGITASPGCAFLLKGGNDMKGKLFKKALAVATSVLMLAGGASVQPFIDIFEDMAITASAADTITVTFNTAGGLPVPETQTVESGGKLTKPDQDPVKEGCTFEGWYIQKHKVEQVDDTIDIFTYFEELDFDTDTITSNTIVCAKWSRPAETVSFIDDCRRFLRGSRFINQKRI